MKIEPILQESFYGEGRGPELNRVHFIGSARRILRAIDYFNADDEFSNRNLWHLVFVRPQVFMFTPEEAYNHATSPVRWGEIPRVWAVVLRNSSWFQSFSSQHLGKCQHYQFMFYDKYLDVICEGIETRLGGYSKQE